MEKESKSKLDQERLMLSLGKSTTYEESTPFAREGESTKKRLFPHTEDEIEAAE